MRTGLYSDIQIVTDNGPPIDAHRFALFSSSVLTIQMAGLPGNVMRVTGIENEVLYAMLHFMYSGEVEITHPIAVDLLLASMRFRLPDLEEVCRTYMEVKMHEDFFADALIVAKQRNMDWLTQLVVRFVVA